MFMEPFDPQATTKSIILSVKFFLVKEPRKFDKPVSLVYKYMGNVDAIILGYGEAGRKIDLTKKRVLIFYSHSLDAE